MEVGVRAAQHVVSAGGCRELVVVVGSRLRGLVQGVELGVGVGEVVHGRRRCGRRLLVVRRRERRREVGRLEVRVLVRRHVGGRRVGGCVAVVMVVVVRRAEGRGAAAAGPDGRDRPMARQPVLQHKNKRSESEKSQMKSLLEGP